MKRSQTVTRTLMLVVTALLWGFTFPFQSIATKYIGTHTFLATRSWIAVLFMVPVIKTADRIRLRSGQESGKPRGSHEKKRLLLAGAACGAALFTASALQQTGIAYTTTAKASFITALYVILVPVFAIFLKQKVRGQIWACVALSVVGLYFLCFKRGSLSGFGKGDLLMLCAAAMFAVQIMIVDHFVTRVDPIRLSQMQVGMQAILATFAMLIFEHPTAGGLAHAAFSIFFAGILSSGVAYTLQIIGQKGLDPTIASIAMCLESVFGAIGGWLIQGQALSGRELLGCVLMFTAIVLSQLPVPSGRTARKTGRDPSKAR